MKKVLTIAGSDPFGGAGLQADLKTFTAHSVYGMTAVTLVSAQNSTKFITAEAISRDMLEKQIDGIFEDIIPDAMKTGMISKPDLIDLVAEKIKKYNPQNVLIDPVMIAHRTVKLVEEDVQKAIIEGKCRTKRPGKSYRSRIAQ